IGVPGDLAVVVGVDVDESGRDQQARRVDFAASCAGLAADAGDYLAVDRDIANKCWRSGSIYDLAVTNDEVMHGKAPCCRRPRGRRRTDGSGRSIAHRVRSTQAAADSAGWSGFPQGALGILAAQTPLTMIGNRPSAQEFPKWFASRPGTPAPSARSAPLHLPPRSRPKSNGPRSTRLSISAGRWRLTHASGW